MPTPGPTRSPTTPVRCTPTPAMWSTQSRFRRAPSCSSACSRSFGGDTEDSAGWSLSSATSNPQQQGAVRVARREPEVRAALPTRLPPVGQPHRAALESLHDTVTRNHSFKSMDELMDAVRQFLEAAQPFPGAGHAVTRIEEGNEARCTGIRIHSLAEINS